MQIIIIKVGHIQTHAQRERQTDRQTDRLTIGKLEIVRNKR